MTKTNIFFIACLWLFPNVVAAKDAPACQVVRMADIGWTDVTSTTAIASELLTWLGYKPEVTVLGLPVTLAGLKNNDLDIFLGNWMPTQEADVRSYIDEKSVVSLSQNLTGAKYTLAVPDYVYEAGVKSFGDIAKFSDQLKQQIYGIESGNDGNRLILQMIKENAFGLKDFRLVESSEQAMLVAVDAAVKAKQFIVFLGWAPHPMNLNISMRYLDGGDAYFGANLGESKVFTLARKDLATDCPNLEQFFKNLVFSVEMENQIMSLILDKQMTPKEAAQSWLKDHPDAVNPWLKQVVTLNGDNGEEAVLNHLKPQEEASESKYLKAPIGQWMERGITLLTSNFAPHFRVFSEQIERIVDGTVKLLLMPHWALLIALFASLAFLVHRSLKLLLFIAFGLLLIVNLGLWVETIKTLVLVSLASIISIAIGVPLGVLAARSAWVYKALRPILDLMQTIPTFVYLIPTLMLFGLGVVPGLISTIIFAIAAPIRLTYLGLKDVPRDLIEASQSFGASRTQTLLKVEIPHALPSIMAGFTQCIMLSLSMVVIAALVGADGLGTPVVRALNTVNIVLGFESGIAIVILAILLDRSLNIKTKHRRMQASR